MHRKPIETGEKKGGKMNRRVKKTMGEVQLQEKHGIRFTKIL